MKQIIKEVLEAEQRVSTTIGQARQRASEIRLCAEEEMAKKVGDAKQKARQIIQDAVEAAKKQAEHIREEKLKDADQRQGAFHSSHKDAIEGLADRICRIILTTEGETDNK